MPAFNFQVCACACHSGCMRKRKLFIFASLILIALALLLISRRTSEPIYNGRSLSDWLARYGAGPDSDEAEDAIRAIGTNALPFLIEWIQHDPPAWRRSLYHRLPIFLSDKE